MDFEKKLNSLLLVGVGVLATVIPFALPFVGGGRMDNFKEALEMGKFLWPVGIGLIGVGWAVNQN